jgi:hypothetical protein
MLSHFERQSLIVNDSAPHTSRRLLTRSVGTRSETAPGHVASNLLLALGGSLKIRRYLMMLRCAEVGAPREAGC